MMAFATRVLVSLLVCPLVFACIHNAFHRRLLGPNYGIARAQKVTLAVHIEVLCPDCQKFFKNQLASTWPKLRSIMNVEVFAYGNAKDRPNDSGGYDFECQHGPRECSGNMMMACAQHHLATDTFVDFTICVMTDEKDPSAAGPKCAAQLGQPFVAVETCMASIEGQMRLHNVGLKTTSLHPKPDYVPWIVIDNIHNEDQQADAEQSLAALVCRVYKGVPPTTCIN